MLRILSITVIFAFLCLPVTSSAQGSKANFSGTWALNAEKSDMGQAPQGMGGAAGGQRPGGFGGGNFAAKQEANLLTVDRTMPNRDGESVTTTTKYTLDGKVSVNSTGRGDSKSTATWSADGKSLTIVTTTSFERDGQTTEMKSTEVWTLPTANTLSVTTTRTSPNGDRKTTMVYDKK